MPIDIGIADRPTEDPVSNVLKWILLAVGIAIGYLVMMPK